MKYAPKYTLVQHSGFTGGGNPQFERAVEVHAVNSERTEKAIVAVGGLIFDDYAAANIAEEDYNGVVTGPFLAVDGTFVDITRDANGRSWTLPGAPVFVPAKRGATGATA